MSKTILEKALLEAEQLEDTMRSNAKEILSSTMKEEIHELVKESLSENDYLEEQEDEEEVQFDMDIEGLEDDTEVVDLEEPEIDLDLELDVEDDTVDDEVSLGELPPLDLTLASDAEVLKVFKAMGDEDGIIIQKDDNEIELTDTNTDTEYLIKLEEEKSKKMKKVNEQKDEPIDMGGDKIDPKTGELIAIEGMDVEVDDLDEVVYEIELDEDDVIGVDAPESEEALSRYETEEHQDFGDRRREREGMRKHYGERPDALHRLSGAEQGYDDREDESLGMLHRFEGDDVEGEVEGEIEETSRLKAGPNSSFSRMAGQKKSWGSKRESRRPRKANLGESRIRKSYNLLKEEVDSLKTKNKEYKKALVTFKEKLNEVSVFNSNLAYVTRLFTEHSTTKREKINILKRFDNAQTLKESKGLYKVIRQEFSQEIKNKTKNISEAIERKITKSSTSGSGGKLLESKVYENPQFTRMKDLMSKL